MRYIFTYIIDKIFHHVLPSSTTKIELITVFFTVDKTHDVVPIWGFKDRSMPQHNLSSSTLVFFKWSAILSQQLRKAEKIAMTRLHRPGLVLAWYTGRIFIHVNGILLSQSTKNMTGTCLMLGRDICVRFAFTLLVRRSNLSKRSKSVILDSDMLQYIEQEWHALSYFQHFIGPQTPWGLSPNPFLGTLNT